MNHLSQQSIRVCVSFLLLVPSLRAQLKIDTFNGQEVAANEVLVKLKVPRAQTASQVIADLKLVEDVDTIEGVGSGDIIKLHS
jgi:hypothetical protein